jgi:proline iminopeptidase
MTKMSIRGISLNVKVMGDGHPLVLMHGGPSADLYTLMAFRPLAKQFTLVFYDHRCNGRSTGAELTSLSMENLTADAEALRQALGFEKWAVLGHSFGGYVAMEYALRYPQSTSHLLLVDTGAENSYAQENAAKVLAQRGFDAEKVDICNRYFNGQIEPNQMFPYLMKLSDAYNPYTDLSDLPHMLFWGVRTKLQPETFIYCETHFLKGWTIKDRLSEIKVPTLVMAGREDFIFPPEFQEELVAAIPNSRLALVDRAGHNPHDEQTAVTLGTVRDFLAAVKPGGT